MQNQIKIISISGLDGSGKTTQIQMLKNYLEKKGEKVFYFHAIQFSIANEFNKFIKKSLNFIPFFKKRKKEKLNNFSPKENKDSGDSVVQANWFLIQIRKIFLIVDIFRFKKLLKKLKNRGYNYLVTDRYFYDSVVNIEFLHQNNLFSKKFCCEKVDDNLFQKIEQSEVENEDNFEIPANTQTCLVIRLIEKIIPRPDTAFYLSVSPDEIVKRDRVPEQGLNYLKIKNWIFNQKFARWSLKKITGENSKEEVFQNLVENLA